MRALLVILLLALANCKFPEKLLEVASCILKGEKFKENFPKVLVAIKSKDFSKIISTAFSSFLEIKQDVEKCLDENTEPLLKKSGCSNLDIYNKCLTNCRCCVPGYRQACLVQCKYDCFKKYCD